MDAVVKQGRATGHLCFSACDAHLNPEEFKKSLWYQSRHMFIEATEEGVSTCRSKGPNGELIERTYDYVIASHSLQGKIKKIKVMEDMLSQGHIRRLLFLVERDK